MSIFPKTIMNKKVSRREFHAMVLAWYGAGEQYEWNKQRYNLFVEPRSYDVRIEENRPYSTPFPMALQLSRYKNWRDDPYALNIIIEIWEPDPRRARIDLNSDYPGHPFVEWMGQGLLQRIDALEEWKIIQVPPPLPAVTAEALPHDHATDMSTGRNEPTPEQLKRYLDSLQPPNAWLIRQYRKYTGDNWKNAPHRDEWIRQRKALGLPSSENAADSMRQVISAYRTWLNGFTEESRPEP